MNVAVTGKTNDFFRACLPGLSVSSVTPDVSVYTLMFQLCYRSIKTVRPFQRNSARHLANLPMPSIQRGGTRSCSTMQTPSKR